MHPLDKIFNPRTIAAIGGSDRPGTVGYALMDNLLSGGFEGDIYPVNPGHGKIRDRKSYASVKKIPEKVDLAVIATPARVVPQVMKECGEAGVGGVVILSAGFKEAGKEGKKRFAQVEQLAKKYDMRVIGPNCVGIISPGKGLNASFATRMALPGRIAFISQSGALTTAILDWSVDSRVGFSHFVSLGSMVDVDFDDLIDYFGTDPNIACILIYMETLTEARRFMSAARAFSRARPIIILKSGKSVEGAKATLSHTGSLAGYDEAFNAAFRRAGVLRVDTISQLFHSAQALAMQPRPDGNRLAVVTNAGGPAVLATDYLVKNGGKLAELSPTTMKALDKILPPAWSRNDPVDVLGDTSATNYGQALQLVLDDENVDAVLVIIAPQAVISAIDIAMKVSAVSKNTGKTLLSVFMGEQGVADARELMEEAGIPNYRYPEDAVDVFIKMYRYYRNQELLYETPAAIPSAFRPLREKAAALIQAALNEGRQSLTEPEGKQLLSFYDLPVPQNGLATSEKQAAELASGIGFPVVMKIVSPDIGHKTEVQGVITGIKTQVAAKKAYRDLITRTKKLVPDAKIAGVLVEQMVAKKYELLIGARKDPIFGPVITFGWGGVAVELLKDVSFGLPPLNMLLAQRLIERTKVYQLLKGYRNMKGVDLEMLQFNLVKFSYLLVDFPEISEIDINPFVVDESGGMVLDTHIILEKPGTRTGKYPYDHLVVSPYPAQLVKNIVLKNGQKVHLRPIRPEDEPLEEALFYNLSKQSIYFRFFGYIPQVDHNFLVRFTQIDYDRELAIVALIKRDDQQEMIGVVRLVNDAQNESAEFAIVVADEWQGQGLGSKMMDFMLEAARKRGMKKITAELLTSNQTMLKMFERRGFEVVKREGNVFRVETVS